MTGGKAAAARRWAVWAVVLCLGVVLVVAAPSGATPPPPPPGYGLKQAGLSTDAASLTRYLQEGLPAIDGDAEQVFTRFALYTSVLELIGQDGVQEARPVLMRLLTPPWPETMERDLRLCAADACSESEGWGDVAVAIEAKRLGLQGRIAYVLAYLGEPAALPIVERVLQRGERMLEARLEPQGITHDEVVQGVVWAALAANVLESSAGVEALLALFEHDQWHPAPLLRFLTGEDIEGWKAPPWEAWWRENRKGFRPSVERARVKPFWLPPVMPQWPPGDTVATELAHRLGYDVDFSQHIGAKQIEEDREWMARTVLKHPKELRALAEDSANAPGLRMEAMRWYCTVDEGKALNLLKKLAAEEAAREPSAPGQLEPNAVFHLAQQHFPEYVAEVAKVCLPSRNDIAHNAVFWLCKDEPGRAYVDSHYDEFVAANPDLARTIAWSLLEAKDPRYIHRMLPALPSGRGYERCQAFLALRSMEVPEPLREGVSVVLEQLRRDPHVVMELARQGEYTQDNAEQVALAREALELADLGEASNIPVYLFAAKWSGAYDGSGEIARMAVERLTQRLMALDTEAMLGQSVGEGATP